MRQGAGRILLAWRFIALGLAAGLAAGWLGYHKLVSVQVTQPIRFSHSVHAKQDVPCVTCHMGGPGASFNGFPPISVCAGCHPEPTGGRTEDEREIDKLITEYVKKRKQVPWLSLAREPQHVRFIHSPHLGSGCSSCHPDMSREDYPELKQNRISGYTNQTMRMARCRACHVDSLAADDCMVCHR